MKLFKGSQAFPYVPLLYFSTLLYTFIPFSFYLFSYLLFSSKGIQQLGALFQTTLISVSLFRLH